MPLKLYMTFIGCDAPGRFIEQHDIFFGIGNELKDLSSQIKTFWPEARKPHLDAWREVTRVGEYVISVVEKTSAEDNPRSQALNLFFLNLGGYKKGEFEEFHYRMLVVAPDKGDAIKQAKETAFFKHVGFTGATSHVDDKYGVDVDEVMEIKEILPAEVKEKYFISIEPANDKSEDEIHLGYFLVDKL